MDRVVGARLELGRGAVPILACGCSDHRTGVVFYTSAEDGGRHVALSGPYPTHTAALAAVPADRDWAWKVDPKACWYGYGTMSAPSDVSVRTMRS